jgi:hypothetical protein
MDELSRALSALNAIPSECSNEAWLQVGMAAKAAGLTLEDFTAWSNRANSSTERDCTQVWRSLSGGPKKAAALYGMAFAAGWKDPGKGSTKPPLHFHLLTPDELDTLPPVRWLVRGVLPTEGIGAIFGPSMSGKSFLVIDLLASVASHDH